MTKKKGREQEKEVMFRVFLDIWQKRKHVSEVSGRWLGKEALTVYFHHILPKSKYKDAIFDEENIILLTWDEHAKVENDPTHFEEINRRREQLKVKYDRGS